MAPRYFMTGTDTDVGKSVASAWAMLHLDADYWKPVQSGLAGETDTQKVRSLTGYSDNRFWPSTYNLREPLSPHEAAKRDNIKIEMNAFTLPQTERALVVEGAGGVIVPLNEDSFMLDLMEKLNLPVILVCRSGLGTINHTLLSLMALHSRRVSIAGLVLSGPKMPHNRQALEDYAKLPIIAELGWLEPLNRDALLAIKPEIEL